MPVTKNYIKILKQEVLTNISVLYQKGYGVHLIKKETGISEGIIRKVLIQMDVYIYDRERKGVAYIPLESLCNIPYSTNEMDYGKTGKGKYTLSELSRQERGLLSTEQHKDLKTWRQQ